MASDSDVRDGAEREDETQPTDEEQVETEWHAWLFAIIALGGVVLILFPPAVWPELGFVLLAVAVVGWILKTVVERWA